MPPYCITSEQMALVYDVIAEFLDGLERLGKNAAVALDQSSSELRFRGEMVVQAGLCDAKLHGNVGVAKAIITAGLHESFRDIQDRCCGRAWSSASGALQNFFGICRHDGYNFTY